MAKEYDARKLAGSILTRKAVRLQTEYIGTWRTKVSLLGVSMDIAEERLGAFFSKFGQIKYVSKVRQE